MSLGEPDLQRTIVKVVDLALQGNEYALRAWILIKGNLHRGDCWTVDEMSAIEELLEDALTDAEGIGLSVDMRREKVLA